MSAVHFQLAMAGQKLHQFAPHQNAGPVGVHGAFDAASAQVYQGVVEGLNNKVKVTMRKSYGFRTFRITELALYHVFGKFPEPQLTHRFY